MNLDQLEQYTQDLGISKDQILREEAEINLLWSLSQSPLGGKVVFYGSTALRLAYNSPRFSEDIDLLVKETIKFSEFKKWLKGYIKTIPNYSIKDLKEKRNTIFALIVVQDEKLKHNFSIRLELHKPKNKPRLQTELKLIQSPVNPLEILLLTPQLEELKQLKIDALAGRKKARDIFDLWYISQKLREKLILPPNTLHFGQKSFENELKIFLPRKYYPIIKQLYGQVTTQN